MADRLTTQFKALLTIKSKSRLDTIADQYNRIFMIRILLVCTTIMAISWYTDPMQCIVPKTAQIADKFVSAACWIQGVYVYKQLLGRVDKNMAYFGIPKNMDHEGIISGQHKKREDLCFLKPKLGVQPNPDCKGMTKTFFLQYQYMPFFIAALSVLYYLPYVLFCFINKDKKILKDNVDKRRKASSGEKLLRTEGAHDVVNNYFPSFHETGFPNASTIKWRMGIRIGLNIVIKILYFLSNVLALLALDHVLNGEYIEFGSKFIKWTSLNNTVQYDYMGMRSFPKPGNVLLPPFGYCEIYESSRDVKTTVANRHKFVCEVSQNILYQYCLALFWFAIFGGYLASIVGLVHLFISYIQLALRRDGDSQEFKFLHLRELELLEFLRTKDLVLYEECKEVLRTKEIKKLDNDCYSL